MDLYFERHDGQAVTVEDFVACFAGRVRTRSRAVHDLVQPGRYARAGVPAQVRHARTKTAELTVSQVLPPTPGEAKKKPLHIPLRLGLLGGNGQELELDAGLRRAAARTACSRSASAPRRSASAMSRLVPVPSLLRGFSAPVNLTRRSVRRRPAVPDGQRQRSLQPLAGCAGLRHARAGGGGEDRAGRREAASRRAFVQALGVTLADEKPRTRLPGAVHSAADAKAISPA